MLRQLHSLPGLIAGLLLMLLAITGAVLSINPALERADATIPPAGQISVAELAGRVALHYPGVEQIQRTPSGTLIVYYSQDGQTGAELIDPLSGQALAPYVPSAFSRWIKHLHRAFLLDTPGRVAAGVLALIMLVMCISGAFLLAKRQGGWRQIAAPLRGSLSQRVHGQVARVAILGLLLSALTGVYMSAATFGLISDGKQNEPDFPTAVAGGPPAPIVSLPALLATDLNDLRELVYPNPSDPEDFYSLRTAQGDGYIDQATGALLSYRAHDTTRRMYALIEMLHTGEGLWWLGLILGLAALSVPLLSISGTLIWWQRHQSLPRFADNCGAQTADTVILVGSESNSTWGFAKTLHDALSHAGQRVHTASMNQLAGNYRRAERLFILTATYGDGDAPASAKQFLARLAKRAGKPGLAFAVLGFGDRQFPQFCQFAKDVQAALLAQGWPQLLELETIDRQSSQEFARWGTAVGALLGRDLTLLHTPKRPRTHALQLVERVEYGEQVQAPTHILRFQSSPPASPLSWPQRLWTGNGLPAFEAGDLVGILPPGSALPRLYSLASSAKNGQLEICVRKQPDGLCSGYLHGLQPGEQIEAFIQHNPDFRPASGKAPVILIGAGTGIGPLIGFIRNNRGKYPMHLYWGGRNPASDFLYEPELSQYLADRQLTQLHAAFSRVEQGGYVQQRIIEDAVPLRELLGTGAQVLVCGGRAMANSVRLALDEVLAPLHLDVLTLKAQGRYREDVY